MVLNGPKWLVTNDHFTRNHYHKINQHGARPQPIKSFTTGFIHVAQALRTNYKMTIINRPPTIDGCQGLPTEHVAVLPTSIHQVKPQLRREDYAKQIINT
jgi:hypothetical protein